MISSKKGGGTGNAVALAEAWYSGVMMRAHDVHISLLEKEAQANMHFPICS
jgi:hypothetical protein